MRIAIGSVFLLAAGASFLFIMTLTNKGKYSATPEANVSASPPSSPTHKMSAPSPSAATAVAAALFSGKVTETMDSGGYTYVCIDSNSGKVWAATQKLNVSVGDNVSIPQGMVMANFHSKTLNRTFKKIYFVGNIMKAGMKSTQKSTMSALPPGHPTTNRKTSGATTSTTSSTVKISLKGIKKPQGGKTIAELFAERKNLAGKPLILRGKVVKFTPRIMGKNWLHIQDGSGTKGTNDLTITSSQTAQVGDTVLIKGKLTLDKDFGAGYKYALIIEDATFTIEK